MSFQLQVLSGLNLYKYWDSPSVVIHETSIYLTGKGLLHQFAPHLMHSLQLEIILTSEQSLAKTLCDDITITNKTQNTIHAILIIKSQQKTKEYQITPLKWKSTFFFGDYRIRKCVRNSNSWVAARANRPAIRLGKSRWTDWHEFDYTTTRVLKTISRSLIAWIIRYLPCFRWKFVEIWKYYT